MTAIQSAKIAPLAVRGFMPVNYLKLVQAMAAKRDLNFSDTVISSVVRDARTTHDLWPVVMQVARAEKRRREEEQQLNAAYLQAQQA